MTTEACEDVACCPHGHPWTPKNTRTRVRQDRSGKTYRVCRACENERYRRKLEKRVPKEPLPIITGAVPSEPTTARPGTPERMAVMQERLKAGLALSHPLDATNEDEVVPEGMRKTGCVAKSGCRVFKVHRRES